MESKERRVKALSEVLHEASETHHTVFKKFDGEDPDWASWYADWLLDLSKFPELLDSKPVRSELVYDLVRLGRSYQREHPSESWETWYAKDLLGQYGAAEKR
jgi:hypothetical protein